MYKMIDGVEVCCSFLLRLSGPVLMAAANALIGLVSNVYINKILPHYVRPRLGIAASCLLLGVGLYLLANIIFNYWACALTSPGFPGDHMDALEKAELHDTEQGLAPSGFDGVHGGSSGGGSGGSSGRGARGVRFCRHCKVPKPSRTHHCSVCKRCVMKEKTPFSPYNAPRFCHISEI